MFQRAQLSRIRQLHQTGRQLAVLKRMYQSYALIIERILDRQARSGSTSTTPNPNELSGPAQTSQDGSTNTGVPIKSQGRGIDDQTFRAPLSSKATVKFERLRDRINLYALSEIQECLDEKESLVFLVNPLPSTLRHYV